MLDFDHVIVGGGPAGSACAIRLSQGGARVALIEADTFDKSRIGETVHPSIKAQFDELKIGLPETLEWLAPSTGISAAWGGPEFRHQSSMFNIFGKGWRVDRTAFDRFMFRNAKQVGAVTFLESRLKSANHKNKLGWDLVVSSPQGEIELKGDWLIAATGRSAKAPSAPSSDRKCLDRLIGIAKFQEIELESIESLDQLARIEACEDGWLYFTYLPNRMLVTVYFTDRDLLPKGKQQLFELLDSRILSSLIVPSQRSSNKYEESKTHLRGFDAHSGIREIVLSDHWLAIGDAAVSYDPLYGQGVTTTIAAAIQAADWLLEKSCRSSYPPEWIDQTAHSFNEYCKQRHHVYGIETRWQNSTFWQRRQSHLS